MNLGVFFSFSLNKKCDETEYKWLRHVLAFWICLFSDSIFSTSFNAFNKWIVFFIWPQKGSRNRDIIKSHTNSVSADLFFLLIFLLLLQFSWKLEGKVAFLIFLFVFSIINHYQEIKSLWWMPALIKYIGLINRLKKVFSKLRKKRRLREKKTWLTFNGFRNQRVQSISSHAQGLADLWLGGKFSNILMWFE